MLLTQRCVSCVYHTQEGANDVADVGFFETYRYSLGIRVGTPRPRARMGTGEVDLGSGYCSQR